MLDAEENLKQKKRSLGVLLNLPPQATDTMDLRGSIVDRAPPPPPESELIQIALAVRPDVVSYRLGVQRAEADVRLARANRMSDVYVLYQPYTLQDNTPFGLKSPTSWALGVDRAAAGLQPKPGKHHPVQAQRDPDAARARDTRAAGDHRGPARREGVREYQAVRRADQEGATPRRQLVMDDTEKLYTGGEVDLVYFLNVQSNYNDTVKLYLTPWSTTAEHAR